MLMILVPFLDYKIFFVAGRGVIAPLAFFKLIIA